jgi:hypothetical protein
LISSAATAAFPILKLYGNVFPIRNQDLTGMGDGGWGGGNAAWGEDETISDTRSAIVVVFVFVELRRVAEPQHLAAGVTGKDAVRALGLE